MGRKTPGIYQKDAGYEVDKWYNKQRIRRRGFVDFKSAEAWLISEQERIRTEPAKRQIRLFEEAAAHYLEIYRDKKRSIESDVYHLKAVMPFIGHLPVDQVHNGTLESFQRARKAQGCKNKTVNLSLSAVRRILNLCARDWRDDNGNHWLATVPLITMLPLNDARPPRPLMWSEQHSLLAHLPRHLVDMVLFDLNTGVRDDVVCSLRWDWEVKIPELGFSIFVVPDTYVKGEDGKVQDRILVCNSVAQDIIERQRGRHPEFVFVWRRERTAGRKYKRPPMAYRPVETMNNTGWQNGLKQANIDDLHVHDLRHTVGQRLREAEVPEQTIADILWHTAKTMTQHYSMATIMELREALELIQDVSNRFNPSLATMVREAKLQRESPIGGLLKMKTG